MPSINVILLFKYIKHKQIHILICANRASARFLRKSSRFCSASSLKFVASADFVSADGTPVAGESERSKAQLYYIILSNQIIIISQ